MPSDEENIVRIYVAPELDDIYARASKAAKALEDLRRLIGEYMNSDHSDEDDDLTES